MRAGGVISGGDKDGESGKEEDDEGGRCGQDGAEGNAGGGVQDAGGEGEEKGGEEVVEVGSVGDATVKSDKEGGLGEVSSIGGGRSVSSKNKRRADVPPASGLFLKSYLVTVSRSGPRARPEPPSPSPDLGLRMDRAIGPASPSPLVHPHCDGGGGWPKVAPIPINRSDKDEVEEEEGDKSSKTKRKKKKRKKEPKEGGGGGKWTFGGLFRRKKKKDDDLECVHDSTEEEYGAEKGSPAKGIVYPPSPFTKRTKNEEEYAVERLGHPCAMHNGCAGCVGVGRPGRSRQRPVFGSGSDCRDSYGGTSLVRRDSSTSSHRERKEMIKARVEAMRERLPKDSSSEEECLPGGSEGSWEWRGKKIPIPQSGGGGGHPHGSIGSAGSSPYLGRRSRFVARTERFHQRRLSREFRDEGEEEEVWRKRPNGLPPQCVPWRASQSDVETPYIGCRMAVNNSVQEAELGGIGSGSAMSYSPAQSPLQSPILSGRKSASSVTSPGYAIDISGMLFPGSNRCLPRRYPSSPISPQVLPVEIQAESRHMPMPPSGHYPMRSRSTDVLHSWRPEEGNYQGSEPNPFLFPVPCQQQSTQRSPYEANQFHQRWPSVQSRSPPPPPPPRDPQRRIATPQPHSPFPMRDQAPPPNDGYVRRPYQHPPPPHSQVQNQENPYMNIQSSHVHPPITGGPHSQGVSCLADSQPRSRRPLRVTAGAYLGRSGEVSYMSDSQVGPHGRRPMTQHPPLESHYAVPFLADSPPPRCVISRVLREPQLAEGVVHNSRPLMRQQRAPVLSRSRSSSPAPSVNNRPVLLPLRPFDSSNENHPLPPRGHSSAPQTPVDGPITRPLSIVSEERTEMTTKIPPVPPARSSSRRSSISSLEAMEFGMWGMERNSRQSNRGTSGLEDALTELENIYKSLKFEDDIDGETDSVLMGSSETGATYDEHDRPLTDDMAYRRLHSKEKSGSQQGVGGVVAQAGSYLLVSPTLGPADPWTEPPPNSINPGEPDITLDDVVFRSIRQANAHMPPEPQPPFGIPLGPVTRAPDSDYLHAKPPSPCPPSTRIPSATKKTPDIVKDDLAFRSLRKDRITNGAPVRPVPLRGVSSPPPRPSSSFSCVSSPPLPNTGIDFQAIRKKRAVRSLSANLLGILQNTSLSSRPISPTFPFKCQLPPPSPPSPRKDIRNLMVSPPPGKVLTTPPPKLKSPSPLIGGSEDSEAHLHGNDATSSDTLTEGHADEPKIRPVNKQASDTPVSPKPAPSLVKDSPGEVYEALGRVLSRVGKETDSPCKGDKVKGSVEEDDLETLLVALAKEARTTSENLGRELDQLRTSSSKSPDVSKKKENFETVIVREYDASPTASPKKMAVVADVAVGQVKEEVKPKRVPYISPSSSTRMGAIASLAVRDIDKSYSNSTKHQTNTNGLNVIVAKCTVGRDLSQPGAISFSSSVSPINPSVADMVNKSDSEKLLMVSAPSAEDPMKTGGARVTATKESDLPSTVSAASADVPIKHGSVGFVVNKECEIMSETSFATLEEKYNPQVMEVKNVEKVKETSTTMTDNSTDKPTCESTQKEQHVSSSLVLEKDDNKTVAMTVRSEPSQIPTKSCDKDTTSQIDIMVNRKSDLPNAMSPTTVENAPITGSMRLILRKNPEGLHTFAAVSPESPKKTGSLISKETVDSCDAPTTAVDVTEHPASESKQAEKVAKSDIHPGIDESGFIFEADPDTWRGKESTKSEESMSPGAVVEKIQKDFDQIFAIPAKKAKKSEEAAASVESAVTNRHRSRESKSLEHSKHSRDARSSENLRKTFPKSLGGSKSSRFPVPNPEKKTIDERKSDPVSSVFEKEFDELWTSNTATKKQELLDSELERELEQLCSVKTDIQGADEEEKEGVAAAGVEEALVSPDAAASGEEAEGSGGHGSRGGGGEDGGAEGEAAAEGAGVSRGSCDDNRLPTLTAATSENAEGEGRRQLQDMLGERRRSGRGTPGMAGGAVTAPPDQQTMGAARDEAAARAERMARYKEERRRQLASQFGNTAPQSSSSSTEDATRVRTTRTSRLRAAAAAAAASATGGGSPTEGSRREAWRSTRGSAVSTTVTPSRGSTSVPEKGVAVSSSDQHNNDSKNEGCLQPPSQLFSSSSSASSLAELSRRERDKSGKRKSNLNRALNVEEVPGTADSNDDGAAGRRRRRRVVSAYLEGASPRRSPEPTSHSVADLSLCRGTPLEAPGRAVRKTSDNYNHRNDSWTAKLTPEVNSRNCPDTLRDLGVPRRISTDFSVHSGSSLKSSQLGDGHIKPHQQNNQHHAGSQDLQQRRAFNIVQPRVGDSPSPVSPPAPSTGSLIPQKSTTNTTRPVEKTNGVVFTGITRQSSTSKRIPESQSAQATRGERPSPTGVVLRRRPVTATVTARRSPRPASYCSGVTTPEEQTRIPLKRAQSGSFGSEARERMTPVHLRSARSGDTVATVEQRVSVDDMLPSKECIIEEGTVAEDVITGEGVSPVSASSPPTTNGRETPKERNGGTPSPPLFGQTVHHQHRTPSSILKRRAGSGEDAASSSGSGSSSPSRPPPVSILKRKAPAQEEATTANHSVLGRATPPLCEHTPQGILKKRPSLDESESRRSHSPLEVDHGADFRPILKQPARPERRLSLEESNGVTTGILKQSRHGGRDEDEDLPPSPAFVPGGLVSRVPGIPPPFEMVQEPRPILKRRSGSEEASEGSCGAPGIPPLSEVPPRPILKRRAGSEEETGHHTASSDERPHPRPILKSSSSSASSSSSSSSSRTFPPLQRRSLDEATCERWRPGWEADEDSRIFHGRGGVMPRRQRSEERPPGILRLRDSSDSLWGSIDATNQDLGRLEGVGSQLPRGRRSDSAPPGDCVRVTSRPHTPPPSVMWVGEQAEDGEGVSPVEENAGAVNARGGGGEENERAAVAVERPVGSRLSGAREQSRFRTQPVTLGELRELARLETVKAYRGSATAPLLQFGEGNEAGVGGGRSLTRRLSEAWEKGVLRLRRGDSSAPLPVHQEASPSPGSSSQTILESPKPVEEAMSTSCEDQEVQQVKETVPAGLEVVNENRVTDGQSEEENHEDEKVKSGSVSARALLFSQIAEEAKAGATRVSAGVTRFRDRKEKRYSGGRFSTQPVTSEEVTEAVRQAENGESGPEVDDKDPSKLSLAERVRLFNQKILDERLPKNGVKTSGSTPTFDKHRSIARRFNHLGVGDGANRFRTQPITTEEVREAMVISPRVTHSVSTTETRSTGTSPPPYRNGLDNDAPGVVVVVKGSDSETKIPKGILKNSREASQEGACEGSKGVGSSDSEGGEVVKSILKVNLSVAPQDTAVNPLLLDNAISHNLNSGGRSTPTETHFPHKGVLKKEASLTNAKNHEPQVRSILKPESEWSERRNSSSGSSTATESSESSETESSEEEEEEDMEGEGDLSQDIASILRNVEMEARLRQKQKIAGGAKGSEEENCHSEGGVGGGSSEDGELEAGGGGSSSSSGGREVRRIIRNEAVARRRHASLLRSQMEQQKEEFKASGSVGGAVAPLLKSRSAVTVGVLPASPNAGGGKGFPFGGRKGAPGSQGPYLDPVAALAAATTRPHGGLVPCQRSRTQPLPVRMTVTGPEGDGAEECILVGGSIAERLAALQKSGQSDWRKRISRLNPEEELTEVTQAQNGSTPTGRVRSKSEKSGEAAEEEAVVEDSKPKGILAERKGKLVEAAEGWRNRVEPSDAVGFSVAGRMGKSTSTPGAPPVQAITPSTSPLPIRRTKKTPRPARFRSKTSTNLATEAANLCTTPTSQHSEEFPYSLKRSISAPGCEDGEIVLGMAGACKVGVPRADDETFTEFFKGLSAERAWKEHLELEVDDFDCLNSESRELLVQKRTVRKQHRRLATSKNPVRALAARSDLREEYIEIKSTGVAEREIRRMRIEKLAVNSTLAVEALAGLASKEDFTAVSLRKANATPNMSTMLPFKHPMLLMIKGRRHVQTRLVQPIAESINHGDTYVLITQDEVYNWIGEYSNVIERSRSAEIAAMVQQKRDLGCLSAANVITIGGGTVGTIAKPTCTSSQISKFWNILGSEDGSEKASEAGHPDEDELYEASIVDTNIVYEVKGEELVPVDEFLGAIPKIQLLDPSKVLVFDFGSELYVWNGKNAPQPMRKLGMKLVKELWNEGCDYSEFDASPFESFCPISSPEEESNSTKGKSPRPEWALLGKVNQHMETVLFREKFLDWPDFSRVIRVKSSSDEEEEIKGGKSGSHYLEVFPCNAKEMLEAEDSTADLELEGSHLGRGDLYTDEEGRRMYEISTADVTMWHVSEFEHEEVSEESIGQFHSGGTYVIRWLYHITVSGRELSGGKSRHSLSGRDRCAYFCWQGHDASLNEKGAAALLTVELDKEKGPQVRLTQGSEPPAFLRIFKGSMVVHRGRRGDEVQSDSSSKISRRKSGGWRLYLCRGAFDDTEAVLEEVLCGARHLRSRASFVLVHSASGTIYLWHGVKSHQRTRKIALAAVNNLKNNKPPEFSFPADIDITVKEFEEGAEPKDFFEGLGGGNRQLYSSLLGSSLSYEHTPRLFHLSSVASGSFAFNEILGPWRPGANAPGGVPWSTSMAPQAFPFLQSELYSASQPSLFLLDNHHEIWLWQGWWPEEDSSPGDSGGEEESRVLGDGHVRGSGAVRWQAERRAAMQTVLDYANLKAQSSNGFKSRAWLVWAGLEPLAFTNLFPEWTDRDDVAEINIREGRGGEALPVEQELARLTRSTYPATQLLQRPLPEGVDPTRLELYLSPQHFQELLGMTNEEFAELPAWKQTKVKKEVGLF